MLLTLAMLHTVPARTAETTQDLDRRLALLSPAIGQPAEAVRTAQRLADAFQARGQFASAAKAISRGFEAAVRGRDPSILVGLATRQLGLCQIAHDAHCEAVALVNLADIDAEGGRTEIALGRLQKAIGLFRQTHDWTATLSARFNAAGARADLGDTDGALAELRNMESSFRQQGGMLAVNFDLSLAELLITAEQPRAALDAARRAREEYRSSSAQDGNYYFAPDVNTRSASLEGRALAGLGRADEARAALRRAFKLAVSDRDRFDTEMANASALLDLGRATEALPVLAQLERAAHQAGDVADRDFHKLAARLYAAAGHAEQALQQETAAAGLQSKLYRASLAEAVAESASAIALSQQEVVAEQLQKRGEEQLFAAERVLERTRLFAVLVVGAILAAACAGLFAVRRRAREARAAEITGARARIAAEIHDTLLQGFIGIAMQIRAAVHSAEQADQADLAERLEQIAGQASASLIEARQAMACIHTPPTAPAGSLAVVTAGWLTGIAGNPHVALTFLADPDLPPLGHERASELHYVMREAVTNALRHSHSSEIRVELRSRNAQLEATIHDNGRGFDPAVFAASSQDRWGVRLMRERMARIGGLLQIRPAPGGGTIVTATVQC